MARANVQKALDTIAAYCSKWRVSLAPEKSAAVNFTMRPTLRVPEIQLSLNGNPVKMTKSARFLGVLFDNEVRFGQYIDELISRVKFKVYVISKLAWSQRCKFPEYSIFLYKALVKPVFDFGSICYLNMLPTHWKKINSSFTQALRKFLKIPTFIGDERVLENCFEVCLKSQIKEGALNRLEGILKSSPFTAEMINDLANPPRPGMYISPLETLKQLRSLPVQAPLQA